MGIFPPQGGLESGKPGSLVVTSSQTLQGSNVYTEVYIISNATLTLAPGASLVTSHLVIDQGATLQLQGAAVTADTLVSEGTISSTSSSDQITVNIGSKLGGSTSLAGTMILQSIGNVVNHILFGSVSGSGTLEINGIASIEANITLSVASVTGAGTLSIASGYTLTLETNLTLTSLTITGAGTLSIASGYTLTIGGNIALSVASVTGAGTLSIASGYTLTVSGNVTLSVVSVTGAGTLEIASGYTLTVSGNVTLSVVSVTGAGTLEIASGYTLTVQNTSISPSVLFSGSGTLEIGSGVTGGSVSTTTTFWGFYVNAVTELPLGSLSTQALLLFSPSAFGAGSSGSTYVPAGTYYITITSGSSLTITSPSGINLAVVSTSSSYKVNTGTVTVDAFTCCLVNNSSFASGAISVGPASSCSGFKF